MLIIETFFGARSLRSGDKKSSENPPPQSPHCVYNARLSRRTKKEKGGVGGICGEYGTSTVGFSVLKNAGDLDVFTVVEKGRTS